MTIKEGMVQLSGAVGEALKGIRKASGVATDPDLIRYNNFKPEDFEQMAQEFGQDNVMDYIKEMELRRLGAKK